MKVSKFEITLQVIFHKELGNGEKKEFATNGC